MTKVSGRCCRQGSTLPPRIVLNLIITVCTAVYYTRFCSFFRPAMYCDIFIFSLLCQPNNQRGGNYELKLDPGAEASVRGRREDVLLHLPRKPVHKTAVQARQSEAEDPQDPLQGDSRGR